MHEPSLLHYVGNPRGRWVDGVGSGRVGAGAGKFVVALGRNVDRIELEIEFGFGSKVDFMFPSSISGFWLGPAVLCSAPELGTCGEAMCLQVIL